MARKVTVSHHFHSSSPSPWEREPFGSICYPTPHSVSRASAAQPSTVPASMPGGGCALPGLHSPARSCRPGKRSAARQQAQEMNGTIRQSPAMDILRLSASCPVAAAPYRAYILPARL